MNRFSTLSVLVILLALGCASVQTAKNAEGEGKKRVFTGSKGEIWMIMVEAVRVTGGTIKEQDEDRCNILASYGATAWSWGRK